MPKEQNSSPAPRCFAVALLGLAAPIYAAHPLVSDDTATQGADRWQLEVTTDHTRERAAGVTAWERHLDTTLTRGLADNVDVAVNLPWLRLSETGAPSESGVGDVALLAKWRFFDNGQGWTLGLRPLLALPTGSRSRGLGNGRATAALTLLSTYESAAWTWLANAGYVYKDNPIGDRKHLWTASAAALVKLAERWTLAVDAGASRAADPTDGRERYGLVGVIHHLGDDLDLDLGWRRSVAGGVATYTLGAGMTLRW